MTGAAMAEWVSINSWATFTDSTQLLYSASVADPLLSMWMGMHWNAEIPKTSDNGVIRAEIMLHLHFHCTCQTLHSSCNQ